MELLQKLSAIRIKFQFPDNGNGEFSSFFRNNIYKSFKIKKDKKIHSIAREERFEMKLEKISD